MTSSTQQDSQHRATSDSTEQAEGTVIQLHSNNFETPVELSNVLKPIFGDGFSFELQNDMYNVRIIGHTLQEIERKFKEIKK